MSIQKIKNQSNTKEKSAVDKRRRFIKGAGVAAPVVLTLSSPSVFGGILCGSELTSGNESQHTSGGSCTPGQNPVYWSDPVNIPWPSPYTYSDGTPPTAPGTSCGDYAGGTTFDAAFGTPAASITGPDTRPMREILCSVLPEDILKRTLIAALLNAQLSDNTTHTYPQDAGDVKGVQSGTRAVPSNPAQIPAIADQVIAYFSSTFI